MHQLCYNFQFTSYTYVTNNMPCLQYKLPCMFHKYQAGWRIWNIVHVSLKCMVYNNHLVLRLCARSRVVIDHKSQATMHYLSHILPIFEWSLFAEWKMWYYSLFIPYSPTLQSSYVTKTFPVSTDTSLQHELYVLSEIFQLVMFPQCVFPVCVYLL